MTTKITGTANVDFMDIHNLINENYKLIKENQNLEISIKNIIVGTSEIIKALWDNGVSTNVQDRSKAMRLIDSLGNNISDDQKLKALIKNLSDKDFLINIITTIKS